jgi:hypothetical protein
MEKGFTQGGISPSTAQGGSKLFLKEKVLSFLSLPVLQFAKQFQKIGLRDFNFRILRKL